MFTPIITIIIFQSLSQTATQLFRSDIIFLTECLAPVTMIQENYPWHKMKFPFYTRLIVYVLMPIPFGL